MATAWEWDDTLFKGSAAYYDQGRLPYAPGLADAVANALKLPESFAGPEQYVVAGGEALVRDADDVVAETFSMSFSAPHLFGGRLTEFEADLRALLREASPSGRFSERLPSTELRIWRKAG